MIEVTIRPSDFPLGMSEAELQAGVMRKLREGGIPVVGLFRLDGVTRGVLEQLVDREAMTMRFRWREHE